ncbi:MAG: universal stress protein [Thermodesulfobacteriota bacterium]
MDPRKILLAIDGNPSSNRAVDYVGRIVGGCPGFSITLMHVIEVPSEDYFETKAEKEKYLSDQADITRWLMEQARERLVACGVPLESISFQTPVRTCASMAACILEEIKEDYGTLVVGRRGIPKSEEFVFGSVSKKLVEYSEHCTVWVVH